MSSSIATLDQSLRASAPVLARLAPRPEPDALRALAFLVRNRASWLAHAPGAKKRRGRPVLEAVRSLELPPAPLGVDAEAALAALEVAFEGASPDPTHGATHVHRHTESPDWASGLRATALIGPYLFLAARGR